MGNLKEIKKTNKKPFFSDAELEVLIKEFLSTKKPSTADTYRKCLNRFVKKYDVFSFTTLARWHESNQNDPKLSNSYIRANYAMICSFFNYIVSIGFLSRNPVKLFQCQGRDGSAQAYPAIKPDQVQILLKRMEDELPYLDFIRFQLLSGCRAEEVLNMKFHKFIPTSKKLEIKGKGNKRRLLALNSELVRLRNRILKKQDLLIQDHEDKKHQRTIYKYYQRGIAAVIKRRGLTPFSSHSLRATYASSLYDNGFPIEQISLVLGHATIDMTKRYVESLRGKRALNMPKAAAIYSLPRTAQPKKTA